MLIYRIDDHRCTAPIGTERPCNERTFPGRDPYSIAIKPGRHTVEIGYSLTTHSVKKKTSEVKFTTVESATRRVVRFVAKAGNTYQIDPGTDAGGEQWNPTVLVNCGVVSEIDQEPCKRAETW